MSPPLEHDYIGLSHPSSMENEKPSVSSKSCLKHKDTELRLGLPGSVSPDRNTQLGFTFLGKDFEDKIVTIGKNSVVSGAKRGFCDANVGDFKMDVFVNGGSETNLLCKEVCDGSAQNGVKEKKVGFENAPAAKAQVVGWPPIRSFRKNTMATSSTKTNDDVEGKLGTGCLYVKVSMDGAPYLRKVDLNTYTNYSQLSSALAKMFSCFTIGQCGSHGLPGRDGASESRLMDLLHGSESVLAYEDKDGDWMLVGDVPWQMFANSCRRLRIMKGSEAIGLAPRATEKRKNRN